MNIFYEEFPEEIVINNSSYRIITDYREWIKWLDMLSDEQLNATEKICLTRQMFLESCSEPFEDILTAIVVFLAGVPTDDSTTSSSERKNRKKLLSYNYDAKFIIPDFLKNYGIDLLNAKVYLHWWKFRILLDGLPEETMTKKVIYYRSIELNSIKDKDERSRIRRIKDSIKLPAEKGMVGDEEIANAFV